MLPWIIEDAVWLETSSLVVTHTQAPLVEKYVWPILGQEEHGEPKNVFGRQLQKQGREAENSFVLPDPLILHRTSGKIQMGGKGGHPIDFTISMRAP